jgi:Uma2 family endonuclease
MVTKTRMTAAEYRQRPETTQPTELIEGEIIVRPAPTDRHQGVVMGFVQALLGQPGTGTLRFAPLDVYLDDETIVQPDVFWVSGPGSRCRLGDDGYWYGAPDLVIEVLSPGTARRDKAVKFRLYEQHGVREYWLADPDARYVEVWRRAGDASRFEQQGVYGPDETFDSALLGQTVTLAQVFPRQE